MKNLISIFMLLIILCSSNTLKSQGDYTYYSGSDGFFNSNSSSVLEYRSDALVPGVNIPHLPRIGTDYNQPASIGSGLIMLTGLGLGYMTIKRKNESR